MSKLAVREVMTEGARSVRAEAELDEAMHLMDRLDARHLPVLEANGELVGMLSDRDLLFATGWIPAESRRERFEASGEGRPRVVRGVMSTPVATLSPDHLVFDLALRLTTDRIGSVAVVEEGRLVGIATETDLLHAYAVACRSEPGFAHEGDCVQRIMTASPRVLTWSSTLGEAWAAMQEHAVRHLPVVAGGELVGLVSDRDLRRAWGRGVVPEQPIEVLMTEDLATAAPETPLVEAAELLARRSISCLPVVTDGVLVGIVTTVDLICHCLERFGGESARPDCAGPQ